jgi:mRNA-degrading endonuclease toxin of MazEF toxin-antitoxin module
LSQPLCGFIYELEIPGAAASHVLVLTEDLWNARMGDSVVVPLYDLPDATPSVFLVEVGTKLKANCTRVQSMSHDFIGSAVGRCPNEAWVRARIGVRKFLDIERRIAMTQAQPLVSPRSDWWPRQNHIHFARNAQINPTDKLYAVISDNDWNSLAGTPNVASVRLTRKTKPQRLRWEVPVGDGFVVTGDIYSVALGDFEQQPPPKKYPSQITEDESAEIAIRQKLALTLS